jgi:putative transposase
MIRYVAVARQAGPRFLAYFLVVETQKMELSVRYQSTVFSQLLEAVSRRRFAATVAAHDGDRYDKAFGSWDHLMALIFVQLGGISSLREAVTLWNVQAAAHYHLGTGPVSRSTLSDANQRRPPEIFAETFAHVTALASRRLRQAGQEVMRLIDATPIPLTSLSQWAQSNGRTRGLKTHVVYDPVADRPVHLEITPSTTNDVLVGRELPIESGAIYVFDKAYVDYDWWHRLDQAGCTFVTRPKTNIKLKLIRKRRLSKAASAAGIISDSIVELASEQRKRLPIKLRRIEVRRDDGTVLSLISNDLCRPAATLAGFYRQRWQIELLFRWIKQHLKIRKFLGVSENAIRLQIHAALIAYLLLRLAVSQTRCKLKPIRFADLVRTQIFERKSLDRIDKPRQIQPRIPKTNPSQLAFNYA